MELGKALSPGPGADMATSGRSCSTGMSLGTSLTTSLLPVSSSLLTSSSLLPVSLNPTSLPTSSPPTTSLPTSPLLPSASKCLQVLPRWPSLARWLGVVVSFFTS